MVRRRTGALLAVFLCCLVLSGGALAARLSGFDTLWSTVDGGGTTRSVGDDYTMGGTIGQPDASWLANGGYTLAAGFWNSPPVTYRIHLPSIESDYTP